MEQSKMDTLSDSPETRKPIEQPLSKGLSLDKPPSYSSIGAPKLGSPLLSVGGWNIHHAGIEWMKSNQYWNNQRPTKAVLLLAIQAVHPRKVLDKVSCLELEIIQDKVVRSDAVSKILWTNPLHLIDCYPVGQWSKQTITCAYRDKIRTMQMTLEPRPDRDDKGVYFVAITLQQESKLDLSDPDLVKFDFHLKGATVNTTDWATLCAWVRRLWCRPSVSKRIDNERTPEIARLDLPFLEQ